MMYQNLRTVNDRNGNPRRLWIMYGSLNGEMVKVRDEGYAGHPRWAGVEIMAINVPPSEYNRIKRWAKEAGILEQHG